MTPFTKCLVHEAKKAYKHYLIGVVAVAIFAVICVGCGWFILNYGIATIDIIKTTYTVYTNISTAMFSGIISALFLIPWWIYIIFALVLSPLLYALAVCLQRRYKIDIAACVLSFIIFYVLVGLGIFSVFRWLGMSESSFITTLIIGSLIMFRWVTGLNRFGKHAWEVNSRVDDSIKPGEEVIIDPEWKNKMYKE